MKKNKYNAHKAVYDGIKFDSEFEMKCWIYLEELVKEGKINNLQRQVHFEIIPANSVYRAVNYVSDFTFYIGNEYIVADAKGLVLPEFRLKQKIFFDKYKKEIYVFKKLSDIDELIEKLKLDK